MAEPKSYLEMSKNINIAVKTTYQFLQVFNGILELTDKELQVLSGFIDLGKTANLCSADTKKDVAKALDIKDPNTLNNYVKRLKDKGAIVKTKEGYKLSKLLMLTEDVVTISIQNHANRDKVDL